MELIIFSVLMGILVAGIATFKGGNFVLWFFYGTFLWPVAIIHSLVMRKRPVEGAEPGDGQAR